MKDIRNKFGEFVQQKQATAHHNAARKDIIKTALEQKEAVETPSGALLTWYESHSTGRSPKNTYVVKHDTGSAKNIDWDFAMNQPLDPAIFDAMLTAGLAALDTKKTLFIHDKVVGADAKHSLPVRVVSDKALTALFADNMFRTPTRADIDYNQTGFLLLSLPDGTLPEKFRSVVGDMVIAMDFDRKIGLIWGCRYQGALKKMLFSTMNYLLPEQGILPLHCSANYDKTYGTTAILGLSGTGKTTLSADPTKQLLGDDEHAWSDDGVFNFEGGCYAKLIDLSPTKEPEIHRIAFGEKIPTLQSGVIIENAMMYPDGRFDLSDQRLTANSRVSYPLERLSNIKADSKAGHAKTILFLTADANGVLPPVSKLNAAEAMFWFIMGYTSKLAGTEAGVKEPISTFSRFFGGPFMPSHPKKYADLLAQKMAEHRTKVYLINTGWTGGAYGAGKRFDLDITRRIVDAAIAGELETAEYTSDEIFGLATPTSINGVPTELLNPINTWADKNAYTLRAKKLAAEFAAFFAKNFAGKVSKDVEDVCPK
jgi:phosphoenolpyruvate carboxykinase (ATP)